MVDNRTPLSEARFVVIDTELTSLDTKVNRMLSVGAIAMDGPRIRLAEQFYRVVNPGVDVPERTILVHGLRPADVAHGEEPAKVVRELAEFIEGAVLVGHFIAIDIAALKKEFKGAGRRLGNRRDRQRQSAQVAGTKAPDVRRGHGRSPRGVGSTYCCKTLQRVGRRFSSRPGRCIRNCAAMAKTPE